MPSRNKIEVVIIGTNQAGPALSGLTGDLGRVGEQARRTQGLLSGFTGSLGGIARQAAGFAAGLGAFALVQGAVGAVSNSFIGLNDRLQQAEIAFTTMLGSGEKARSFLDDLAKFAAASPFEFPDLVDASKRLMAFGFSAQEVIPVMTAVGNAAAAMGGGPEMMARITTAMGQMTAKGKVQAEEMLQLTEAGIPAWAMLAEKLGVDVAGAMKLVEQRAVDSSTMIAAFQEGTTARFGDMMAKQSRTFSGAMSTVKDSLSMALAKGFKPFFDVLTKGMVAAADFLSGDAFGEFAARLGEAATQALDSMGRLVGGVRDLWDYLSPTNQRDLMREWFGPRFSYQIDEVVRALKRVGGGILDFGRLLSDLVNRRISLSDFVTKVYRGLESAVKTIDWGKAWKAVTDTLGSIAQWAGEHVGAITAWLGAQWAKIDWADVWKHITDIASGIGSALGDIAGIVTTWLGEQWARIEWDRVWQKVTDLAGGLARGAGEIYARVTAWLGEQWAKIDWEQVWRRAGDIVTGVGAALQAGQAQLQTAIENAWKGINWGKVWAVGAPPKEITAPSAPGMPSTESLTTQIQALVKQASAVWKGAGHDLGYLFGEAFIGGMQESVARYFRPTELPNLFPAKRALTPMEEDLRTGLAHMTDHLPFDEFWAGFGEGLFDERHWKQRLEDGMTSVRAWLLERGFPVDFDTKPITDWAKEHLSDPIINFFRTSGGDLRQAVTDWIVRQMTGRSSEEQAAAGNLGENLVNGLIDGARVAWTKFVEALKTWLSEIVLPALTIRIEWPQMPDWLRSLLGMGGTAPKPGGGGSWGGGTYTPPPTYYQWPTAANGASWVVGGNGGIDSQLVRFMATPGERILVSPPGGQGANSVNINAPLVSIAAVHVHNEADEDRLASKMGVQVSAAIYNVIRTRPKRPYGYSTA